MKAIESATAFLTSKFRMAASLGVLLLAAVAVAHDDKDRDRNEHANHPPKVPVDLQVPAGNEVAFRLKGVGVQIYVWTQSTVDPTKFSWVLKAPHAVLLHHDDILGIHFGGPTWQGNDGSKVVATRINGVTVDADAVPWLLLKATSNVGPGIFADITYIQRVKTDGGLAPVQPGAVVGQEVLVPYDADYYFYRAK